MRGELKGKDAIYYEFGKNEDWENLSEIEKIVRLKEKKKEGVMLTQDKKGVKMSPFQLEVKEMQVMEVTRSDDSEKGSNDWYQTKRDNLDEEKKERGKLVKKRGIVEA